MTDLAHGDAAWAGEVSPWVARWSHVIVPGSRVVDVACGTGRHARWFASRGCHVTAIDRDPSVLDVVRLGLTDDVAARIDLVEADLEANGWPFANDGLAALGAFDAVVVTNYLWRTLLPKLVASVAPGGVLLYETFSVEQAAIGRPTRTEFLLRPGELLEATAPLRTVAYEHGLLEAPRRWVQRIAAVAVPLP